MSEQNHYIYEFGPFRLDTTRRVLLKEGEPVKLFPKEFDTLLALVERGGEVLGKDELMRQVWPDAFVEESNLTTYISHLRKLLGEGRGRHDYIVTVPGRGYRFVAGVKLAVDEVIVRDRTRVTIEEKEGESVEQSAEAPAAHSAPDAKTTRAHGYRLPSGKLLISAVAVVLTVAAFASYRFTRLDRSKNQGVEAFSDIKFTRLTNSGRSTIAAMSPDGIHRPCLKG